MLTGPFLYINIFRSRLFQSGPVSLVLLSCWKLSLKCFIASNRFSSIIALYLASTIFSATTTNFSASTEASFSVWCCHQQVLMWGMWCAVFSNTKIYLPINVITCFWIVILKKILKKISLVLDVVVEPHTY